MWNISCEAHESNLHWSPEPGAPLVSPVSGVCTLLLWWCCGCCGVLCVGAGPLAGWLWGLTLAAVCELVGKAGPLG